ncbi:hypothetical protein ACFL0X_01595 [Nanoarchaeota archaeon]
MTFLIRPPKQERDILAEAKRVAAEIRNRQGGGKPPKGVKENPPAEIDPKQFVKTPTGELISLFELPGYNKLNWEQTHFKLADNGLYMPKPETFMPHFANVVDAFNRKSKLFYADGSEVERPTIETLYNHLTTNHFAAYESEGGTGAGVWTWLNAMCEQKQDKSWRIKHARVENNELVFDEKSLEACLMEDCFVDFRDLTSQGLGKTKKGTSYEQGKNIKFYHPVSGRVARFIAVSDWADLNFDRNPVGSDSSLGVFGARSAAPLEIRSQGDCWTISGVLYKGQPHTVDLLKQRLDHGANKTQAEWAEYSKQARGNKDFSVGDFPLYHALFRALYEQKDNPKTNEIRDFLEKSFVDYWLMTLTRLKYQPGTDETVHDFGLASQYSISQDIAGPHEWVKDSQTPEVYQAILGDNDLQRIQDIYHWITKKDARLLRLNEKPNQIDERVARFYAGSDRAGLFFYRDPDYSNSSLGVRAAKQR